MNKKEKIGYKDIFRQKEYMKMIVAALVNRFGDAIDAIAFTWIVYEITGNAAMSAMVYGINKIPSVVITPLAGAWVEGRNKKRIMVVTDIIRALCVTVIATGYLLKFLNPAILVAITFIISTVEAFRGPANTALTPKVLEKKYYDYGMSLMSTACSVVELVGMAVAAGVIALIGSAGAIYVDMATFIVSALIILTVNTKEENLEKQNINAREYVQTLKDGFVYVKKDKVVLFFGCVAFFLNAILVPFNSMQAPLANEILGGGAEILTVMSMTLTIGVMLGTVIYPMLGKWFDSRKYLILCCIGLGLYYIGFILCKPFYVAKIFMYGYVAVSGLLCGIVVAIFSSFFNVELVKQIDEDYLARISGIMSSLCVISIPVTSFVISAIATLVETEMLFVFAGLSAFVACPLFLSSKVMAKEKKTETESETMQAA